MNRSVIFSFNLRSLQNQSKMTELQYLYDLILMKTHLSVLLIFNEESKL